MSKKFATNIDLLLNELQNAKIHIIAADPSSPLEGQIYYNSTTKTLKFYNGSSWIALGTLNQVSVATNTIDVNNQFIANLKTPTDPNHAATKEYVDGVAQGLDAKESVICATTANITLSGLQAIDGITVVAGDRVLVKNQTTAKDNGIYIAASGAWSRSQDTNTWDELRGAFTFVEKGTTQADTGWICTVDSGGTLGTTSVTFVQFSAAGQITASNLGSGGANIFSSKNGLVLEFRQLKTTSGQSSLTLTQNTNDVTIGIAPKLESLTALATDGILVQSGSSVISRSIATTGAGITVSSNANGVSGNPTLAIADDLAAIEALSSTGFAVRTGTNTWATRSLTAGTGITITQPAGTTANPTIAVDPSVLHDTSSMVRFAVVPFTFVSNNADITLAHNLNLPAGTYDNFMLKVIETSTKTVIEVDLSNTPSTNTACYIKMNGVGLLTTPSAYTAIIQV